MKNRKIYLFKDIYDNIRLRQEHIEDGLEMIPYYRVHLLRISTVIF